MLLHQLEGKLKYRRGAGDNDDASVARQCTQYCCKIHILIKTIFGTISHLKSTKQIPDYVEKQDALRAKGVSCLNKPIAL